MRNLKDVHPDIATEFESGKFVGQKTHHSFSSMAIDQAHEQNNAYVKGDGGTVGLTASMSQLTRWMVAGPEVARVISEFEISVETIKQTQSQGPDVKHHEQVRSVLVHIVGDAVVTTVRTIKNLGKELYTGYVKAP